MKYLIAFSFIIILCNNINLIDAHGRLWDPVARPTAWRLDSYYPKYFNDNVSLK
jgi:hypothetical protein